MFDEIPRPALREGRQIAVVDGYDAGRGDAKRHARVSYVVKYEISIDLRFSRKVRLNEIKLRQYSNAMS